MEGGTFARTYGRVLVIEQDDALARLLVAVLETRGYNVVRFSDSAQAVDTAERERPSLVILDLNAPSIHGFQLYERLRKNSHVPILVLGPTASVAEASTALNLGADDYVPWPFSLDELLVRIKALMRRSIWQSLAEERGVLQCGDLSLDLATRRVICSGTSCGLTPLEFDLLRILATHQDQVVTHGELLVQVWGPEYGSEREYLRVHIRHLRQKIEPDPSCPRYIHTVTRVGYRLSYVSPAEGPSVGHLLPG